MNPARSVPGSRGTAVPAVGADIVGFRSRCIRQRLRRRVGARLRHQRPAATRPCVMGRPGPGPGGRLPTHTVGLFRCSREPKVSLPRRSRARRPTLPDRLRGQRSTAFRVLGGLETQSRVPASVSVLIPTSTPARPSRLRDSKPPRPPS